MLPKDVKDFYEIIDFHRNCIKNIDKEYKQLLRNSNKVYVIMTCQELQSMILDNVNFLNSFKNSYKVIPKKQLKDVCRKINAIYLGYLQESKNIQAVLDIWELE